MASADGAAMHRNRLILLATSLAASLTGCGSNSLTPDAVRSIPDGDGQGAALTGHYDVETRVIECHGSCGPFTVGIFSSTICDVGDTDTISVDATQSDGHLRIETDDLPSLFEGGAFTDGSFEVGGYATQLGGDLEIAARSLGSIDAQGHLSATLEARSWGNIEGQHADCRQIREATGARED
ncbi:MAG: hypothetical protein AB7S26_03895 [Sandaracinaceae bacterium]